MAIVEFERTSGSTEVTLAAIFASSSFVLYVLLQVRARSESRIALWPMAVI
jgi:hypothetical protein